METMGKELSQVITYEVLTERDRSGYRRQQRIELIKDIITYVSLGITSFVMLAPFLFLIATSLTRTHTRVVRLSVLLHPTLANYRELWSRAGFSEWMRNSFIVTMIIAIALLFLDSLAGYTFAKKDFRGKNIIFLILLSTLMIPLVVYLLPTFLMVDRLHLINTYPVLILPALAGPMGVFMMRQFIQTIPSEIIDAARIDGCSELGIYWRMIVPLSVPGLAVLGIFTFLFQWGNFLWPLIVATSNATRTIPPGLATFRGERTIDWGLLCAGSLLSMIPPLIIFLLFQRYLQQGIAGRGAKG